MTWPKISIITPSFNQGQYLEQTIKSVVEQNYPNLEYFILDGGSTDRSVKIIKKYAQKYPKIIKWRSYPDEGQVSSINEGMQRAKGEIVAYLNSDDGYLSGTLKRVVQGLAAHPNQFWLTGPYLRKSSGKSRLSGWITWYTSRWQKMYSPTWLMVLNFIPQPSTFWRKKAALKVGLFNSHYKLAFDYDYWLRLNKLSRPVILDAPLSFFRIHATSKSNQSFEKQFQEQFQIAKKSTNSRVLLVLHWLHLKIFVLPIYRIGKFLGKS